MGKTTRKIRLAVTAGDPYGIGPEVILGALAAWTGQAEVTVYGDPEQFGDAVRVVPVPAPPGTAAPSAAGGRAALTALELAIAAIQRGEHDALTTGPISKQACGMADGPIDGHTPLLGRAFEAEPLMTFVWDENEPAVALLTHHIPLRAVPASLTSDKIERAVQTLRAAGYERIAVLGLNPHAGEAGRLGTEEIDFIAPAVQRLAAEGLTVFGPLPGDAAFAHRERFDAILALYHDQGLGPVKALAFDRAVQVTRGLPVVRTSPAHGTAFDIAGQGKASPNPMRAAMEWAIRLATR
ncbi:MAG: PdxA family dehydrogenase [Planctomycetota bacterium]|jgi:4-hydroxythreonine-4-phosphate dehydrogenase